MTTYSDQLTDQNGVPIIGALIYVSELDGTPVFPDPIITDAFGRYSFDATDDVYRLSYRVGGKEVASRDAIVGLPPQFKGDPGGNVLAIGLFTAIGSFTVPVGTQVIRTSGYNTLGIGSAYYVQVGAGPATTYRKQSADGRWWQLWGEGQITPQMFGALGNNVADDYAAVQAAIDWCATNKKRLNVPTGNYKISGTLVFNTVGWEFIGEGINSSRFWSTTTAPACIVSGFAGVMKGIDFRGQNIALHGVILLSASLSRFENCDFIGFTGHGIYYHSAYDGGALTGRQNNTIIWDGCQSSINGGCGIKMELQPDNNGSAFRDVTLNSNGSHGMLLKGEGNEVRGGNIFANAGYGIQISELADTSFSVSNKIHDCWIESNVLGGVRGAGKSLRNWVFRKNLSQSYTAAAGSADMEVTLGGGGTLTWNNGTSSMTLDTDTSTFKINGTQVLSTRETGWAAMTGTASKAAIATYTAGATLTFGATYTQSELTALATRLAAVEAAVQANSRRLKASGDALILHGLIGA